MAEKQSRLTEIYKAEKSKGGGIASTLSKRTLEKVDPRQFFNQKGFMAAALPSLFKSYSATPAKSGEKVSSLGSGSFSSGALENKLDVLTGETRELKIHSKISAKNSESLPMMARDMNVMRQNITKLVKLQGGTAASRADKSSDGGLLSGIGSVFSGILGAGSSIVGGIFSALGSIVGAGGAKILGGAPKGILAGLGIGGIIVSLAAGSLISSLYSGMDFAGIASSIGTVIDDVVKNIKNFFGFGENSDDKNFFEKAASYLDKAFNTSNFTDGLNSVVKKMQDITDDISIRAVRLYNDVMIATLASVQTIGDVFLAIGLDLKSSYLKWIDDNAEAIFATIGAAVGGAFGGPKGAAAGAIAGTAYGFTKRKLVDEQRDTAVNDLQPQVANLEMRIADLKKKNPNQSDPREAFTGLSLTKLQEMLDEKKSLLATKQTEIQERKGNNVSALTPEVIQKKIDERKQNLRDSGQFSDPTNTKPTPTTAPSSTGAYRGQRSDMSPTKAPTALDITASTEGGGRYDLAFGDAPQKDGTIKNVLGNSRNFPQLAGKIIMTPQDFSGKPLTAMTLAEVKAFQEYKNREAPNTSALGKYGFVGATLFGNDGKSGLVAQLKLPMDTIFSPDTQELLQATMRKGNAAALEQQGVAATDANLNLANIVGAGGVAKLLKPENANKNALDVLGYARGGDVALTNPGLNKLSKDVVAETYSKYDASGMAPGGISPSGTVVASASAPSSTPAKLPSSPLATLMASAPKAGSLLESLTGGYEDVLRAMQEKFAPNQTNITNNTVANAGQQGTSNLPSVYDDEMVKLMDRAIYGSA